MNLLITGATGFVGRNLLLQTLESGRYEKIFACVRDPGKLARQLNDAAIDADNVVALPWGERIPAGLQVDHAVHCAGVLFARNRDAYFSVNVDQSMNLISSLPASTRLIVLSSQSAGGPTPPNRDERTMDDPDRPLTWYGLSKVAMEKAVSAARPTAIILRPPMILGPRDQATLPLFQMAAGKIRPKPGLKTKWYSWIAVEDLARDILELLAVEQWDAGPSLTMYAASPEPISDRELVACAATQMGASGIDLPLPHPLLRAVSWLVDAVPALRAATPSLTRDRVKEIFPDRWIVDAGQFRQVVSGGAYQSLDETMKKTHAWYQRCGLLK